MSVASRWRSKKENRMLKEPVFSVWEAIFNGIFSDFRVGIQKHRTSLRESSDVLP